MGGILNDFAWFDEGGDCPVTSQFDCPAFRASNPWDFFFQVHRQGRLAPPSDLRGILPDNLTTREKSSQASGIMYVLLYIAYKVFYGDI